MKHKIFTFIMTLSLLAVFSPVAIAETGNNTEQEKAPTNVSAKATKKATIVVKWSKVPDAKSYEIYRSTKKTGNYKSIKKTKSTKFTDKKIHPKKRYFYKVSAKVSGGGITVSSFSPDVASAKLKIQKSFKVKAYAYTGGGTTKIGKKAMVGRIAVDPKVIKLGSWLYVEGYGVCQACDTGGNINGKTIDVYKNTAKQARQWGVKKPKVYVIK